MEEFEKLLDEILRGAEGLRNRAKETCTDREVVDGTRDLYEALAATRDAWKERREAGESLSTFEVVRNSLELEMTVRGSLSQADPSEALARDLAKRSLAEKLFSLAHWCAARVKEKRGG